MNIAILAIALGVWIITLCTLWTVFGNLIMKHSNLDDEGDER